MLAAVEEVERARFPRTSHCSWAGQSLQEKLAGGTSPIIFGLGIVVS